MDRETLEDRAIFATDGSLESARASYNTWAASEWDRNHDGPPTYVLGENGQKRELVRPKTLMQQRL